MKKYVPSFAPAVRRALAETLPESVASAAVDLIYGDMSQNPQKVGKPLLFEFEGKMVARIAKDYRIIYRIDENKRKIVILRIRHREHVYKNSL